jgi:steroid 5-alpha reductase family enzyme
MALILGLAAVGLGVMALLWALQLRSQNAATADVGWSFLVVGGVVAAGLITGDDPWRRALVTGLAGTWALRLGIHLLRDRVLAGRVEDGRYRDLRERWKGRAPRNFFWLYLAQTGVAALFITPVAAAMRGGQVDGWAAAGVVIWLVAVAGEAVADRQLARFRADPANRGAVCRAGLWRYSRHPNYFFEWVHWWAYVLIGRAAPLTLLGPAAMLLFLFGITGIPVTERQALKSRGEPYRAYQRTTSVFVPWPPRRSVP